MTASLHSTEPVELAVNQRWQTTVVLASVGDEAGHRIKDAL